MYIKAQTIMQITTTTNDKKNRSMVARKRLRNSGKEKNRKIKQDEEVICKICKDINL